MKTADEWDEWLSRSDKATIIKKLKRQEELYLSACQVTCRLQSTHEHMVTRVECMARGAYRAYLDYFISCLPPSMGIKIVDRKLYLFPYESGVQVDWSELIERLSNR